MHDVPWDDFRFFLAAHRAGSFSRAAVALRTQQSTVSRRIAALEHALGGALFHRSRGGLVPTALAEAVVGEAAAAEAAMGRVLARAADLDGGVSGIVRIAVAPGLAHHWLIPLLPELRARHPALRFDIVVSLSVADLTRREADIALRFVRPRGEGLVARRLGSLEHAVLAHPRWRRTPWDALEWVVLDVPGLRTDEGTWTDRHGGRPPVLRSADWEAVHAAVRAGIGATVSTRRLAEGATDLVVLDAPAPLPPPMPLWVVTHRATRTLPRVDAVWQAIVGWAGARRSRASDSL